VLLDDTITQPLRDVVFAAVERERLAVAVTAIGQLTRSPDDRARELVTRSYTGVRRYLPLLLDTIEFHATDGGEAILEALTALNRSEGRRKLTQLNALGLIVNTSVLYNTIYTQRAIDHIAASTGSEPRDKDVERLSPLGSDHITLTGRYRVLLPAPLHDRGAYRALNTPGDAAAA
jgi:hypothetical protein